MSHRRTVELGARVDGGAGFATISVVLGPEHSFQVGALQRGRNEATGSFGWCWHLLESLGVDARGFEAEFSAPARTRIRIGSGRIYEKTLPVGLQESTAAITFDRFCKRRGYVAVSFLGAAWTCGEGRS